MKSNGQARKNVVVGIGVRHATAAVLTAVLLPHASAEIFTCVDAKGRRLTADRPIADCIDREQKQISPSGNVLRRIGPSLTAEERAALEEKARRGAEERNRVLDEKKRDRALLTRFPTREVHDKERAAAIANADEVAAAGGRRLAELRRQRRRFDAELEFYKADPSKVPARLKRQIDDMDQQIAAQTRFIAGQEAERQRIGTRYDEELTRLNQLWALHAGSSR